MSGASPYYPCSSPETHNGNRIEKLSVYTWWIWLLYTCTLLRLYKFTHHASPVSLVPAVHYAVTNQRDTLAESEREGERFGYFIALYLHHIACIYLHKHTHARTHWQRFPSLAVAPLTIRMLTRTLVMCARIGACDPKSMAKMLFSIWYESAFCSATRNQHTRCATTLTLSHTHIAKVRQQRIDENARTVPQTEAVLTILLLLLLF